MGWDLVSSSAKRTDKASGRSVGGSGPLGARIFNMHSIAWWPSLAVLLVASGIDLCTRRVLNWLTVPFLISGLAARSITGRLSGAAGSLAGITISPKK